MNDFEQDALNDAHVMIGFMTASKGEAHKAGHLKTLFNHAGKAVPPDLAAAQDQDSYNMPRNALAGLVYDSARKNGAGVIGSAVAWVRTRF